MCVNFPDFTGWQLKENIVLRHSLNFKLRGKINFNSSGCVENAIH